MRALVVCDKVEPILYSAGIQQHVGKVDLVISCGDLPHYYIEFIMSMLGRPTYYVHGNHARTVEYHAGAGDQWKQMSEPLGAVNLHMQTAKEGALLLAGLEGSIRYNSAPQYQYTQSEMLLNVLRLAPQLMGAISTCWWRTRRPGRFTTRTTCPTRASRAFCASCAGSGRVICSTATSTSTAATW